MKLNFIFIGVFASTTLLLAGLLAREHLAQQMAAQKPAIVLPDRNGH